MRIKKKHVIEEINNDGMKKNTDEYLKNFDTTKDKIKSEIPSLSDEEVEGIAAKIAANESVNKTTVSITKGKLLETILNKKPRKVVKTIRVGDIKR
jgi:vacuolar-type H+-ATPase subunit H